eukprot:TRINITY_DN1892_c0_g1_i1.p1 TRINITY_DN1892_c0_g1~~TRINITY_DN1892_c0_g1_i1.p1  ORF type:complete len:178 (+),score=48.16 TRINITY_DN1892_c0_g1_i1:439-972(+)
MDQYVNNTFSSLFKTTVGADIFVKDVTIGDKQVILQLWDTAGQERFRSLGATFYRGADACVLVYDVTQSATFEHLETWLEEFKKQAGLQPGRFPYVVVGNKVDLEEARSISLHQGTAWAKQHDMAHFEASAKQATNVREAFQYIAEYVLSDPDRAADQSVSSILDPAVPIKPDSGCC